MQRSSIGAPSDSNAVHRLIEAEQRQGCNAARARTECKRVYSTQTDGQPSRSTGRDAERARSRRRAKLYQSHQLAAAETALAQRMSQEQVQQQNSDEIAPAQTRPKTASHETNRCDGRVQTVTDRKETIRASGSGRIWQVRHIESEQGRCAEVMTVREDVFG